METWFHIIVTLAISFLLKSLFTICFTSKKQSPYNLPPTPPTPPIIGNFTWLRKTGLEIETILRALIPKLGPMFAIQLGRRLTIVIADRTIAHQALVQNGAIFASRPAYYKTEKIVNGDQVMISASFYGPQWRLLRRNLTSEILHPSRVKSYSHARKWVLQVISDRLEFESKTPNHPIHAYEHFQFAMFCLLALMCFGDKLSEDLIKQIEVVQKQLLIAFNRSNALNLWPSVTKLVWRKKWEKLHELKKRQEEILLPLIRARKKLQEERDSSVHVLAYVDTLLGLELPDKKRKLEEGEIVNLASEFLNAGTDTTATALQWIMANLVKYPDIQERLFMEIKGVLLEGEGSGTEVDEVEEVHLQKMPFLKAVIMEGLRRHPPGHFVLPHEVTEDAALGKYFIPKGANVNIMVAHMGLDPEVWEEPMEFRPDRFIGGGTGEGIDITGSREIRMMPFGVGRRICPALGLAMLHLEYFVANLVWRFEWKAVDGYGVDLLSERNHFTVVMKYPLQAHVSPRSKYFNFRPNCHVKDSNYSR